MNCKALAPERLSIECMIVGGSMKLLPFLCIMLQNGKAIGLNEKCAVGNLTCKTDAVIPLTLVFNKFNILGKCY